MTKKTAVIRGKDVRKCPFGLPIPQACLNAGNSVHRMAPSEDEESIKKANRLVYSFHKDCTECPFADKVLKNHQMVDCDFGDTGEGQTDPNFVGSPLYPQTFHGTGLSGLYGYPLGFYADNNESRNIFFGLFSLLGSANVEEMIKLADEYDRCKSNKVDILDTLLNKISDIKSAHPETFEKIEKYLSEYRQKYEDNRSDTGLLWDLTDAWYGPRQTNR
jgi:hypothetical protein